MHIVNVIQALLKAQMLCRSVSTLAVTNHLGVRHHTGFIQNLTIIPGDFGGVIASWRTRALRNIVVVK